MSRRRGRHRGERKPGGGIWDPTRRGPLVILLIGLVVLLYYAGIVAVDGWEGITMHLRAQVTRIDRGDLLLMGFLASLGGAVLTVATSVPAESSGEPEPHPSHAAQARIVVTHCLRFAGFAAAMFAVILISAIVLPPKGG